MSLDTYSAFIYGHDVSAQNNYINFSEDGGPELAGTVKVGSYTLTDFANAVSNAFNENGDLDYVITVNRSTRKITISASANFDLLVTTGTNASISAFNLIGFTQNKTGSNSYEADIPSGFIYEPQYKLQSFVDFEDIVQSASSKVNTSASGVVEVISFGQNKFMECNIIYATDIPHQDIIKNNPNGVADLRAFMNYLIQKKPIEFCSDINNLSVFTPCILERTRESSEGTSFQLYELYARKLAKHFETQLLRFRQV